MKIIYDLGQIKEPLKDTVVVIGVFDGVHVGHQKLINEAIKQAHKDKTKSVLITFFPHPVHVLRPEVSLKYITSLKHRLLIIEELGIEVCIVISFTLDFSKLSPREFIKDYLVDKVRPKHVFIGDDFRFGQNRSGSVSLMEDLAKEFGFNVHGVKPLSEDDHDKISSTDIRHYIQQGRLEEAQHLLGRPVSIVEEVIQGDARGTTLGFPTINLYPQDQLLPPHGVYAVRVRLDERQFNGMANVGFRPTFKENDHQINVEVHLFDFNETVYGKLVEVQFLKKIRDEQHFPNSADLISQLKLDEIQIRSIL